MTTWKKRALTALVILIMVAVCFASGYAAARQTTQATQNGPVSDALKLRAERLKNRAAQYQIAMMQLDREKLAIEVEARAVGDELRKALGAKPDEDIDLVNYVVVKKPTNRPVAEPPAR